jgi:hypothetical protein
MSTFDKSLTFEVMVDRINGQGTRCTKMGADKLAENHPNGPKFIFPNCLPKPKSLGIR